MELQYIHPATCGPSNHSLQLATTRCNWIYLYIFEANYVSRDGANLVGAVIDYGVVLEADGAPVTQHVH